MLNGALNIFYMDDDQEDQLMFMDAASEVSNKVRVFTQMNGDDLMKVLYNSPPSPFVIFLDLNMPIKNGFEVLKEIRASDEIRKVPVIIFTTSDNKNAIETTRELGATMYIPKPMTYKSLKLVIKHILSINWETFSTEKADFVYRFN